MINTPQAPYFDDFNIEKNFLKILFKPKLSVQTRELEQIQSMFQNQIETLASQIFENGSVVSGGKFSFKERVNYVKLYNEYDSQIFNYSIYKDRYVYGNTTEIVARVFNGWSQSTNEAASLYVDYLASGINQEQTFQPGEVLQIVSKVYMNKLSGSVGIGDILQGSESGAMGKIINIDNNEYDIVFTTAQTFQTDEQITDNTTSAYLLCTATESTIYKAQVKTLADDAEAIGQGSAVYVDEGIYYIDGYFVHTGNQSKIISNYSTDTNARVGFEKEVEIVTSNEDPSLLDNAAGYPNANAPGADRLKINLVLNYYHTYETPSENFIEIMTISDSVVTGNSSTNKKYSDLLDTLARRTYDESGNYTVNPFLLDIHEFLDENDNNGIYKETHFGYNTQREALRASMDVFGLPSPGQSHIYGTKYYPYDTHENYLAACRNRLAIGVESGKAYVMGYEIEHNNKTWHPILKARDTKTLINSGATVFYGNYIKVKSLAGLPDIYHHQSVQLSSSVSFTAGSNIVGTARVYALEVDSGIPGDSNAVYRLYIDSISMNSGKNFSTDVKSIGSGQTFSVSTILTNGVNTFYGLDKAPLIFTLEKGTIASVQNSSYNYKKLYTGTITSASAGAPGVITLSKDQNERFTDPTDINNYVIAITSGAAIGTIVKLSTVTVTIDASGYLSITGLPSSYVGSNYAVLATLHKQVNNIKTKLLQANTQFIDASGNYDEIVLNHADGYRLIGIYESADISTTPTTSDTNITENYEFDDGQRDTYYDLARVRLKPGAIAPTGQVLVVYDYFTHSAGDYFTVDSYEGQVQYTDIPTYTSGSSIYELKDCIDMRGRIDDNGSGFTSPALPYIMENNSVFECDLSYYLPRLDLLELNYKGVFNIKYGTSSEDPQYPIGSINSMTLYYLAMPAYTEKAEDVVRIYVENKRYTMRDIGNIDNRVSAIEDYILMNDYENDTNNLSIYDVSGYQCIKTGFIVDMFTNHDYSDTTAVGYRCSIDPDDGVLRPDYRINTVELERSANRQSTVTVQNGLYMIPYTDKVYMSNSVNTSYIVLNTNKLVEWEGNVVLNKTLDTIYNAKSVEPINFGNALEGGSEDNSSVFGRYKYSWLGTSSVLN